MAATLPFGTRKISIIGLKRPLFVKDEMAVLVGFRDTPDVTREKLGI